MNIFWILTLAVVRPIYFIYALSCLLFPVFVLFALAYGITTFIFHHHLPSPNLIADLFVEFISVTFILFAVVIPLLVYGRKSEGYSHPESDNDPNPFQSALMSWFGTLRWYWNTKPGSMARVGLPSGYLVENPTNYRLSAKNMRDILSKLQPGDILLRAYDGYLDGEFIRRSSTCSKDGYRAGWFTHAAFYAGTLNEDDRKKVPAEFQNDTGFFQEGSQMVFHSMAKGVHVEDILTWFRCDYLAVLRIKSDITLTCKVDSCVDSGKEKKSHHAASDINSQNIKNDLRNGVHISRDEVIQNARLSALEKIGEPYDFECVTTDKFSRFSCAELVYFCFRSIHDALGIIPQLHAFYPLGKFNRHWHILGRETVTPDDFYQLAQTRNLDIVWIDEVSKLNA